MEKHLAAWLHGNFHPRWLVEKHLVAHNSWGVNLPSVAGNEHSLPSVTVHGGYVLLPEEIEYRHALLLASVGGKYSPLTVPVRDVHVQLPAIIADECILPCVLAGCSTFCL